MVNGFIQSENQQLMDLINVKRIELLKLAAMNGLTSNKVVKCSQELDRLIFEFQSKNRHGNYLNRMELTTMDGIH